MNVLFQAPNAWEYILEQPNKASLDQNKSSTLTPKRNKTEPPSKLESRKESKINDFFTNISKKDNEREVLE